MFFQKKSNFLPGMITGAIVGLTAGAGCMIMAADKKKMNKLKKSVAAVTKKVSEQMHIPA